MPYIKQIARRNGLEKAINSLVDQIRHVKGTHDVSYSASLNYSFTKILKTLFGDKYDSFKDALGTLEACKLEYYRTSVARYEDSKKRENGDV